jgi:tetratricopeptide (TPR) repeat protein
MSVRRSKKANAGIRAKSSSHRAKTNRSRLVVVAGLLLVVMTAAAYLPATRAGFVWDDDEFVENNETLRSIGGLCRIWFELGAQPYQYYPMVHTAYWIEYRLWGLDPAGYHIVNILLHAVSAILLWRVLIGLELRGAWVAAAIFSLHPVQVESVAWITERKNVLSGVFYFGAALAYLRWVQLPAGESRRRRPAWLYAFSLVLFLCALLSKTVACTLPAALLLVLWWKRGRVGRGDVAALAPFFAFGIALGLLTAVMERDLGIAEEVWSRSVIERCLIAGRALWFYAGKLLWPAQLLAIYPRWQVDAGAWHQYLYPLTAISVVVVLWLERGRIGRGPLVAVLCFAGTLFPALGFVDVAYMVYSFVADHFQYLASVALVALVTAVGHRAADGFGGWGRRIGMVVVAFALIVLGSLTWRHAQIYRSRETLWRDTIRNNPKAWLAHNNLGTELTSQGRLDEAISRYRQVLAIRPVSHFAHTSLGNVLSQQRRYDEAISHFQQALHIAPDHSETHTALGNALAMQHRMDEAIGHYRCALRANADSAPAHYNLAMALKSQGRLDEAIAHHREAARIAPDTAMAHYGLGLALTMRGQHDQALESFREAERLKPDWAPPLNSMAWLLATHQDLKGRDADQAIRLAERACELTNHQNAEILDTLAAAYAAAREFDRAVSIAQKALALASANKADELVEEIRERLELYRQGMPYLVPVQARDHVNP